MQMGRRISERLDYFFIMIIIFFFQIENMKCKDQRLKIMNEILNGIKVSAKCIDKNSTFSTIEAR